MSANLKGIFHFTRETSSDVVFSHAAEDVR